MNGYEEAFLIRIYLLGSSLFDSKVNFVTNPESSVNLQVCMKERKRVSGLSATHDQQTSSPSLSDGIEVSLYFISSP